MRRLSIGLAVLIMLGLVAAFSRTDTSPRGELLIKSEAHNPWTHLKLNNDKTDFRFAFVSDRTGGPRPGVFERAVEHLNLLQPEFVVSVGDLIQGGIEDLEKLNKQWTEFDGFVSKLEMPFFYVPGNHDLSNALQDKRWQEKFGRRFYHFVYKDTLFLLLNTEDPPPEPKSKGFAGRFSAAQVDYAKQVLGDNRGVRWTFVVMHRPIWHNKNLEKTGWLDIEQALNGRPYTVVAGHEHRYQRTLRNGQRYYVLATTGGSSKMRGAPLGEFDHVVWVTMKKNGPVLANLMSEGIYSEDIKTIVPPKEEPVKAKGL
jgi:3',5'-cyclic AMP phosphodiesterase CpdA